MKLEEEELAWKEKIDSKKRELEIQKSVVVPPEEVHLHSDPELGYMG